MKFKTILYATLIATLPSCIEKNESNASNEVTEPAIFEIKNILVERGDNTTISGLIEASDSKFIGRTAYIDCEVKFYKGDKLMGKQDCFFYVKDGKASFSEEIYVISKSDGKHTHIEWNLRGWDFMKTGVFKE